MNSSGEVNGNSVKRYLPFLVPFVSIVVVGVGVKFWVSGEDLVPQPVVQTDFANLDPDEHFIRIEGMAHYPVVINQTVPGNLFTDDKTYYLFPLFSKHDTSDRAIRIMVRTTRKPERMVSYEFMALEGRISFPDHRKLPFSTEIEIGKRSDYFFTDEMVLLEPWKIESDGEVWELHQPR